MKRKEAKQCTQAREANEMERNGAKMERNEAKMKRNETRHTGLHLCVAQVAMCEGKPFKKCLVTSRPMILNDLSKPSEPCTHRQPSATFRAMHSSSTFRNLPSRALIETFRAVHSSQPSEPCTHRNPPKPCTRRRHHCQRPKVPNKKCM